MSFDSDWVLAAEQSARSFAAAHGTTYNFNWDNLWAAFEVGCFHVVVDFYRGPYHIALQNLTTAGEYRYLTTPNGNPDADTEVSPTSHETMEAITDPDTTTGWYDSSGFENGDECAYVFGATHGTPGQLYNQIINHGHYLTQEEFSNRDFAATGGGCLPFE